MPADAALRAILVALVGVFLALVVLAIYAVRIDQAIEPIARSSIVRAAASF